MKHLFINGEPIVIEQLKERTSTINSNWLQLMQVRNFAKKKQYKNFVPIRELTMLEEYCIGEKQRIKRGLISMLYKEIIKYVYHKHNGIKMIWEKFED